MAKNTGNVFLAFVVCAAFIEASSAEDAKTAEIRSLDEQVQEIKSDVLGIAAELSRLEERLLYPSNTEVAVFVAIAEGQKFRLDAVQMLIDGELATHYIYSFKELEALQKGGTQRVYTGNVATGAHELVVTVNGKLESGKDFSETATFGFDKGVEPELLEIVLAGSGAGQPAIQLGDL